MFKVLNDQYGKSRSEWSNAIMFEKTHKIEHDLHPHLNLFNDFHSTKSLEQSALYQELRPRIMKLLHSYELQNLVPPAEAEPYYRAVAWNIERGICFEEVVHFLKNHPILSKADILLITETDLGMARSKNRNVAQELALRLEMNYFFAPSYLNLAKGAGVEAEFDGENELGIHGNSILSRYPIHHPRIVPIPNTHDKMKGREKRLGSQRALIATIDFPRKPLRTGCIHVNVRSTQKQRKLEIERLVKALREEGDQPALIGGDWNTSTYDSHNATAAIIGFWVRVAMGVGYVMRNHYPYPERLFERKLFRMLEKNGFDYKNCNALGICTNHYSVQDIKQFKNLSEWIPNWCFRFLEWGLKDHGGRCSLKLDWFAQKKLKVLQEGVLSSPRKGLSISPQVIGDLIHNGVAASDHDAIVFDFQL